MSNQHTVPFSFWSSWSKIKPCHAKSCRMRLVYTMCLKHCLRPRRGSPRLSGQVHAGKPVYWLSKRSSRWQWEKGTALFHQCICLSIHLFWDTVQEGVTTKHLPMSSASIYCSHTLITLEPIGWTVCLPVCKNRVSRSCTQLSKFGTKYRTPGFIVRMNRWI